MTTRPENEAALPTAASRANACNNPLVQRLFAQDVRRFACRAQTPLEFGQWQVAARDAYAKLLALPVIAAAADGHRARIRLETAADDLGEMTRRRGAIETEPEVWIEFWMLTPKGHGPFPLALTPHGHGSGDLYAGVCRDEDERRRMEREDSDGAVQAARNGFLAIAPATRGIGINPRAFCISDHNGRHHGMDCVCHNWHSVLAGRTLMGERVWDLMRIIDWATTLPEVHAETVLVLGNSGGGMATLHAAAIDERVTLAICSCAFNSYLSPSTQRLCHCACNYIPGMLTFGEFWDVAGLIAPRALLTVNGTDDPLHPVDDVKQAVAELQRIYAAAGAPNRYQHAFGNGGHRFYKNLMWPFVQQMRKESNGVPEP